jgi:hypothetical protein
MANRFTSAKNNNEGTHVTDQDELQLVSKSKPGDTFLGTDSDESVTPVYKRETGISTVIP